MNISPAMPFVVFRNPGCERRTRDRRRNLRVDHCLCNAHQLRLKSLHLHFINCRFRKVRITWVLLLKLNT